MTGQTTNSNPEALYRQYPGPAAPDRQLVAWLTAENIAACYDQWQRRQDAADRQAGETPRNQRWSQLSPKLRQQAITMAQEHITHLLENLDQELGEVWSESADL